MKISQLLLVLQNVLNKQGDLDVVVPNQAADRVLAVQVTSVVPQREYPWKSLVHPVLSIEPTDDYQASPEPEGDWNHDLSKAPEGVVVRVMKRRGGEDTGIRTGDKWAVFEGGGRAWEIIPGGVLAWRAMN